MLNCSLSASYSSSVFYVRKYNDKLGNSDAFALWTLTNDGNDVRFGVSPPVWLGDVQF
jgi:hypothetical protein